MHAMLGVCSVWFIIEDVVLDVIDSCTDGEFHSPARVLLERQCVAEAEASSECRSAASVVLDTELAVEGEVVPSQAEVRSEVEAFVTLDVVACFWLKDDAAELD